MLFLKRPDKGRAVQAQKMAFSHLQNVGSLVTWLSYIFFLVFMGLYAPICHWFKMF